MMEQCAYDANKPSLQKKKTKYDVWIIKLKALTPMLAKVLHTEMTKQNSFHCINENNDAKKPLTENKYVHITMVNGSS